ncbi:unnamed protein product, partial [Didymodactylos carnosus]
GAAARRRRRKREKEKDEEEVRRRYLIVNPQRPTDRVSGESCSTTDLIPAKSRRHRHSRINNTTTSSTPRTSYLDDNLGDDNQNSRVRYSYQTSVTTLSGLDLNAAPLQPPLSSSVRSLGGVTIQRVSTNERLSTTTTGNLRIKAPVAADDIKRDAHGSNVTIQKLLRTRSLLESNINTGMSTVVVAEQASKRRTPISVRKIRRRSQIHRSRDSLTSDIIPSPSPSPPSSKKSTATISVTKLKRLKSSAATVSGVEIHSGPTETKKCVDATLPPSSTPTEDAYAPARKSVASRVSVVRIPRANSMATIV